MKQIIYDARGTIVSSANGDVIRHTQYIPDSYMAKLAALAEAASRSFGADCEVVCSYTPAQALEWKVKEGFDVDDPNTTTAEIVARLKRDGFSKFVPTNKRI